MTTIAYKDGILAADTQATAGSTSEATMLKVARNAVGDLAGACGSAAYSYAFLKWFTGGEKNDPPTAGEDDGGVIIRKPATDETQASVECFEQPSPPGPFVLTADIYTLGSGSRLALGAMAFGASAEEAVRIASRYDIYTNDEVTVLTHDA